ncbi:YfhO family protein [Patescibacteria group bacterium]|nr:YfhO family protein [Patescibacteria group bacterium]
MKRFFPFAFIFFVVLIFFWQMLFKGLLPIPSDTIVGLYYPFRDLYAKDYPRGIPFKNFLITDPVRQQYPWRSLIMSQEKTKKIPTWNPYNFAGTPLAANFQSAGFYPFNILFFALPFSVSWSILIFLQPFLAGIFLYYYLRNLKIEKTASLLGGVVFSFSGFFIAWMEWGTIIHTALWLPLILLSIDKIFSGTRTRQLLNWFLILALSMSFSFLAGHLQTFFYLFIFVLFYIFGKLFLSKTKLKKITYLTIPSVVFLVITFFQWLPTIKFILLSARNLDLVGWKETGWFIPWQNLIQFLAPDFFGNPATLNYYGIWNYGEFIGYVGIVAVVLSFFAMFFRRDKKTLFFGTAFFVSLILALPTFFAKIPFMLNLPFISTSQPTRLLFITDFSLSVLAALGFDYFIASKRKKAILYILFFFLLIFAGLWSFVLFLHGGVISSENLIVSRQNLIFPTALFVTTALLLITMTVTFKNHNNKFFLNFISYILILIVIADLFRFGWKFEPFTKKEYLYPKTPVTSFLQNQKQPFRVMSTDSRIFPPNFSIMYKTQTLDGYDPLYLQRYGELMAAMARKKPDISSPFGFNRIIIPQNTSKRLTDLLNVKYVLSLEPLKDTTFKQVFNSEHILIYENSSVLPRAFFVSKTLLADSKQEAINKLFDAKYSLNSTAVVETVLDKNLFKSGWNIGRASITDYREDSVLISTSNMGKGFLVLTDSFYPTWHAKIDGKETKIYLTDFNFRGIIIPEGKHVAEFYNALF